MASKVDLVLSRSVQTRFYTLNLWDYVLDYLCSIDKTFLTKDRMFEISTALIILFALVKDISTLHYTEECLSFNPNRVRNLFFA